MNTHNLRSHLPLLGWAFVLLAAMLSFYVHLLAGHVERGAQWRESFARSAPPAKRMAAERRQQPPAVTRTAQR